eukprot:jgi/Botrbrau1/11556/Bobra.60_1s0010.1
MGVESEMLDMGTTAMYLTPQESEHEETRHLSTGMMVFAMIVWMTLGHKLAHSTKFVGEGMSAALTGLAMGFILLTLRGSMLSPKVTQQLLTFDHSNFFVFFLPPIILQAGLGMRKKAFFANWQTIISTGILGTYVAFAIIAVLLYAFSRVLHITLADCLALGAIFATTDSVAVLQVLNQERSPLLFNLVLGRASSMMRPPSHCCAPCSWARKPFPWFLRNGNHETSAGLPAYYEHGNRLHHLRQVRVPLHLEHAFGPGPWSCVCPSGGKIPPQLRPQAVGVIGLSAYMSYLIGDYMGLSGIVALFCCAVAISHYTMKNISRQFRTVVKSVFETLSYLAEGSIFVYVGLDALDPEKWSYTYLGRAFGLFTIVLVLLLRVGGLHFPHALRSQPLE